MNGIFLAASCLGALVTISMAEPKMQELKQQEQLQQEQSSLVQPIQTAELTTQKLAPASSDLAKGTGSMTTTTVVEADPRTGEETASEEQIIAFHD
jgi:hypothetical protein